jgi:bromodomain-containing factor 1
VSKNAPELPTKYIPPPPPPAERTSETKAKSKPGTKGRKNKPMSAAEQEAKIKDIETRIHSFENPNYQAPARKLILPNLICIQSTTNFFFK